MSPTLRHGGERPALFAALPLGCPGSTVDSERTRTMLFLWCSNDEFKPLMLCNGWPYTACFGSAWRRSLPARAPAPYAPGLPSAPAPAARSLSAPAASTRRARSREGQLR